MLVVGVWSIVGINQIVGNAQTVIGGNEFRGEISQREVDHLNWAIGLNELLTDDNVHQLGVETDPTQCAFGRWYYSDARQQAEQQIPALAPLLAEIEQPHNRLHASATAIDDTYVRVDASLGAFLRSAETEQLDWTLQLKSVFVDTSTGGFADIELDHTQTDLGQFLYSAETTVLRQNDRAFDLAISEVYEPYEDLYASAAFIADNLSPARFEEMRTYYVQNTEPLAYETLAALDAVVDWHDAQVASLNETSRIYATATTPALREVQSLLGQIVQISADSVMTDQIMLSSAQQTRLIVLVTVVIAAVVGIVLAVLIASGIVKPLVKGVTFSNDIASGDLNASLEIRQKDEIGQLADSMREMQEALQTKAHIVQSFAQRDFTIDVEKSSDVDGLGESLIVMKDSLNDVLNQVQIAVEQVASGAAQVSSASQDLSQGATESASSLEEISASITQINGQSKENMSRAAEASNLSKQAATDAIGGQERMSELQSAMTTMSEAAGEIGRVVKVIDDIAFQINLLALNANVEAARAGKYGKGFAVVAEEVRNLAVRSAEAVKETTAIVEQSVRSIESGTEMSAATSEQLDSIAGGAQRVAEFLEEISESSREQSLAIAQISEGLNQVDQVTQANTASAEESAAASEELTSQAEQLRASVSSFRLIGNDNNGGSILALPQARAERLAEPKQPSGNGRGSQKPERPSQESAIALDDDEGFDRF